MVEWARCREAVWRSGEVSAWEASDLEARVRSRERMVWEVCEVRRVWVWVVRRALRVETGECELGMARRGLFTYSGTGVRRSRNRVGRQ